jgi:UDP:flavonoid glycosyltransferase YjiC (YdhE family)
MVSANPLEMRDPDLPPPLSGLPIDDRSEWGAFHDEFLRVHKDLLDEHNDFRESNGVGRCDESEFNTHSPWLNLYLFPEVADYPRRNPLDPTWHRLNSTVRTSDETFDMDEQVPGQGKVIYLSLGSLGCMDVGLMQRLIDALDKTEHRVIVSMGPLHEQLRLGERMYGGEFLPQPSILPQCDLLMTHGGNNTTCEGFHFGLPMIGLPLFWDQYDNAQRLRETAFGLRLPTYDWTDDELAASVDRLLDDQLLRARMRSNAEKIQADPGRLKAADLIEQLLATGEPVTR